MHESYNASITLWPAATLPASVAEELQNVGVDLAAQTVKDGQFNARRDPKGNVVLDLSFDDCLYGLTSLEAVLATLRLARISYVAWDAKKNERAGTARAFDAATTIEHHLSVTADGEPVLTAKELEKFDKLPAAEVIDAIPAWLAM